jgi:hypothetical protein
MLKNRWEGTAPLASTSFGKPWLAGNGRTRVRSSVLSGLPGSARSNAKMPSGTALDWMVRGLSLAGLMQVRSGAVRMLRKWLPLRQKRVVTER